MMSQNGIESDPKRPCCITMPGVIHRHLFNSVMGIRFNTVVAIVNLKSFQVLITAIKLCACAGMTISDYPVSMRKMATNHINFFIMGSNSEEYSNTKSVAQTKDINCLYNNKNRFNLHVYFLLKKKMNKSELTFTLSFLT
ncbi:hypothetical protein SAMN05216516_104105 [Izhakiella capsodis]|uniref:Uncharacterized protein n=1 Tax=Izhakiella capsodis TaxID=1367852 RepID=A0A1I4XF04_9GAMM|nr:hypothetical protein SAMN05216516_104105 [Izhakiella capsodis]